MAEVHGTYEIAKADDEAQNIFGFASVAILDGEPVTDSQGDVIPVEELEAAAYDFVLNAGGSGEDHNGEPVDGVLIESMVFTPEKNEKLGIAKDIVGWWAGFHIADPESYRRAKTSKSAFSIEGTAIREPM